MTIIRFDLYEYPIELNDEFKNKNIVLAEGSSVKAYAVDPTDYQMSLIKLTNTKPVAISINTIVQTFHSFNDITALEYLDNAIPNVVDDGQLAHKLFLKLLSGVKLKDSDFVCSDNFDPKYAIVRTTMQIYLGCMYYYLYVNQDYWTRPETNELTVSISDLVQLLPESAIQLLIKFSRMADYEVYDWVEHYVLSRKPYRSSTTGVKRFAVAMKKEISQIAKQKTVMV